MQILDDIQASLPEGVVLTDVVANSDAAWSPVFLWYGMVVYVRRDGDAPKARRLLRKTADHVYGRDNRKVVLETFEKRARSLEDLSVDSDDLSLIKEKERLLLGILLVYLATVDGHWSTAQHQCLDTVLEGQLSLEAADIRGWLTGSWPSNRFRMLDAPVERWAHSSSPYPRSLAAEVIAFAKRNRTADISSEDFRSLRQKVDGIARKMQDDAHVLGPAFIGEVKRCLDILKRMQKIRIAVLGEFNVGKSSVINQLLGRPDLSPTDIIPSTSGIIEITEGSEDRYFQLDLVTHEELREVTHDTFHRDAGDADQRSLDTENGDSTGGSSVERWRVEIPSLVLSDSDRVTLIDTPGLNEDPIRDDIARKEARRAHASVIVMNSDQVLTQYERELIEIMSGHIRGMTIVLNKADRLGSDTDVTRVKDRVLNHLKPLGVTEQQVIPFCAAPQAPTRTVGYNDVPALRSAVRANTLQNVAPLCYNQLLNEVERFSNNLTRLLERREEQLRKTLEELEEEKRERDAERQRCKDAIDRIHDKVYNVGNKAARRVSYRFGKDWEDILYRVRENRGSWKTKSSPLTSPKKSAEEIAKLAQKSLIEEVNSWSDEKASEVIGTILSDLIAEIHEDMEEVGQYVERTQGIDSQEAIRAPISSALKDVFDIDEIGDKTYKDMRDMMISIIVGIGGIGGGIALALKTAVASAIFIKLAILSNPIGWAAAVLALVATSIFLGKSGAERFIKRKVSNLMISSLSKEKVMKDIQAELRKMIRVTFRSFGDSIHSETSSIVDEAEHQLKKVLEQLNDAHTSTSEIVECIDRLRVQNEKLIELSEVA